MFFHTPLGGSSPSQNEHLEVSIWEEHLPRIPPKRKTSNLSPSSGLNSFVADGSSKQTEDLLSAKRVSTLLPSAVKPGTAFNASGRTNDGGTDDKQNFAPA